MQSFTFWCVFCLKWLDSDSFALSDSKESIGGGIWHSLPAERSSSPALWPSRPSMPTASESVPAAII